ncbi:hypothetical protein UAW_01625 [Enterococcus haemoperoxidus ATCC BAA-382]|uniref:Uncharacterized protein n=1 Tax=Enterococcus haemoperoxidus ATCC BAA-382 TaxID=1158608 RepID=R2QPF8_9ENTE|nr:hypothetical protein [Enterococcus haemoperoxidus]EOH97143.1 hypothetical protein UAW_01625 [Enterococcus haemoperoxidus ATCC BAA-382]EOT59956.1 hypothetical protein I583_02591 [Enterococcus haemoperoxidus ATCC BAA-382]
MENFPERLEGRWIIRGTNFPLWLSKKRSDPTIQYEKSENSPLKFLDIVTYNNNRGQQKKIIGIDTYKQNHFVWRGKGLLAILSSKWSILTVTETILVIKFDRSFLTPAGIDILVREGIDIDDPKQFILDCFEQYSLTASELNSLVWL